MELATMSRKDYNKAITAMTAVDMALEYLDECEGKPDADWLRFILMGCPLEGWQEDILREEDCPEEQKKGHRVLAHRMPDEEFNLEQI